MGSIRANLLQLIGWFSVRTLPGWCLCGEAFGQSHRERVRGPGGHTGVPWGFLPLVILQSQHILLTAAKRERRLRIGHAEANLTRMPNPIIGALLLDESGPTLGDDLVPDTNYGLAAGKYCPKDFHL